MGSEQGNYERSVITIEAGRAGFRVLSVSLICSFPVVPAHTGILQVTA